MIHVHEMTVCSLGSLLRARHSTTCPSPVNVSTRQQINHKGRLIGLLCPTEIVDK